MVPSLSSTIFVLVSLLLESCLASLEPAYFEQEQTISPHQDTVALLREAGIESHGNIFFNETSPEILGCLHQADAKARLFQICATHEVANQCRNNAKGDTYVYFDRCQENTCLCTISTQDVYCRLKNEVTRLSSSKSNKTEDKELVCGVPARLTSFFDAWSVPSWMKSIGGENYYSCFTAFPNGTQFHFRFVCTDEKPEIQMQLTLPSDFFKGYYQPQCVIRDRCGGPSLFSSEAVCFESVKSEKLFDDSINNGSQTVRATAPETEQDFESDVLDGLEQDIDLSGTRLTISSPFLALSFSFVYVFFC